MTWLETLVEFAQANLGERELEALWMRGVSDEQIEQFRIGYLDGKLPRLDDAKAFLDWCWQGRKLQDVHVFPLTNSLGHVKGVQFRYVDRERKGYMDYMAAEDEPILFGLAQAMPAIWETGWVFLVEGVYDLAPIQRVFPNVVATLTDRVTRVFTRLLRRLVDEIWLGYDMDQPGREACERFVKFHGREFKTRVVQYPRIQALGGQGLIKDPGDLWEAWGDERFGVFLRRLQNPYEV